MISKVLEDTYAMMNHSARIHGSINGSAYFVQYSPSLLHSDWVQVFWLLLACPPKLSVLSLMLALLRMLQAA
jgi:hypothetical protein